MMDIPRFPSASSGPPSTSPGPFSNQQQQTQNKMGNFASISAGNKVPGPAPPNAQSQQPPMSQSQPTGPMDMPGPPPSSNYGCSVRSDNVPLNPNSTSSMSGNPKVSHFDPISSLAQMSQQLTNSVASNLNGQGQNQPGGMMNFSSSMHMGVMDMGCHIPEMEGNPGSCNMMIPMHGPNHPHQFHPGNPSSGSPMGAVRSLSPKMGPNAGPPGGVYPPGPMPIPPRMMGRLPGCNPYNGANIQVKPSAPNTIQYLPAKPQMTNHGNPPRGPPSLDFLQRFANPMMNTMDGKMPPNQGIPGYFGGPGGGGPPNNGHMGGPPPPPHHHMGDGGPSPMGGPGGGMPVDGPPVMGGMPGPGMMNGGMVPPPGAQGMGPSMGGGPGGGGGGMMGPQGPMGGPPMGMPMVRGGMRPPGGMNMMPVRMPQMGFNGPTNGGVPPVDVGMFPPNQPQGMYVSGPKSSPMGGIGQPDASQPLPPSIGQSSTFKSSPFVGPTTTDPNYAQQFHNFQQQLYATTTRSQLNSQAMGPGGPGGPGPPPPQQPYFVPK